MAPNLATYYLTGDSETPIDTFGGRSLIVDYKGRIVGQHLYGAGSSYVAGTIDIDALRYHRTHAQWDNWMKDLRTEIYQLVYEQPIYPEEPVPGSGAVHPRRVPRAGDRAADRADDRARHLARPDRG